MYLESGIQIENEVETSLVAVDNLPVTVEVV